MFRYRQQLVPMFSSRIVGGSDTTIEQHPWQISMTNFGSHRCGGSILTERKIITAAHCSRGTLLQYVAVRVGSTFRTSGGILFTVNRIIEHESYNVPTYLHNDVALMFLTSALTFGSTVQPIRLPEMDEIIPSGTLATVSGWGTTEYEGSAADILQVVTVPIVDLDRCTQAYVDINPVTDGMLCSGARDLGPCNGDSGGPLLVNGTLHGIVSWAEGCAQEDFPSVNARVAHYRNWIDNWDL